MALRVYEHPLAPDLADSILDIPVAPILGAQEPRTIRERVAQVRAAIAEANEHLVTSPVAKIVARSLMLDLKKRGEASIVVKSDGAVVLRVVYGVEDAPHPLVNGNNQGEGTHPRRDVPGVTSAHKSDLPYLDSLREEAVTLGVDVSHLGRQRRAIHEYLAPHREGASR